MADTPIEVPVGSLTLTGFAPIAKGDRIISEAFNSSDSIIPNLAGLKSLSDTYRFLDNPRVGWKAIINEAFNGSEVIIVDTIIRIVDELFASEGLIVSGEYKVILAELLETLDIASAIERFIEIISEDFNLSESLVDLHRKLVIVIESLQLQETILDLGLFQHLLGDDLNFVDSLERIFAQLLGETFQLSELIDERGIFLTPISESFNVSEILAEVFTASTTVVDTFQGTDSAGNQVTFFILSNDQVMFKSEIIISGETFACWVLTSKQYNPSIYSNFDFNSYGRINEKLYGARADGIYLLEGDNDSGSDIHTGLLFDFANMDIPATKRMRSIHLGAKNPISTVQVSTDRGISKTYKTKNQRAVIGREVRGKFWTVSLEDVENLKSMELNVVFISKKR